MQMVSMSSIDESRVLKMNHLNENNQRNDPFALRWKLQARDEEKNRRNNKDSTNQVMKDLEDLLPNKSLIPPPIEDEDIAPPGTMHTSIFYIYLNANSTQKVPGWNQSHNLLPNLSHCTIMSRRYFAFSRRVRFHLSDLNTLLVSCPSSQMLSLRRAASLRKWRQVPQPKGLICRGTCPWPPPTPELQWPAPLGRGGGLLGMPGDLHLDRGEEEDMVDLQGDKNPGVWSCESPREHKGQLIRQRSWWGINQQ